MSSNGRLAFDIRDGALGGHRLTTSLRTTRDPVLQDSIRNRRSGSVPDHQAVRFVAGLRDNFSKTVEELYNEWKDDLLGRYSGMRELESRNRVFERRTRAGAKWRSAVRKYVIASWEMTTTVLACTGNRPMDDTGDRR